MSIKTKKTDLQLKGSQQQSPRLTIVAAMGENRVIGNNGALPWDMPADLAHFKAVTLGKPVIMGLNTYRAIGRLLPGRKNIILSHVEELIEGAVVASSIDAALEAVNDVTPSSLKSSSSDRTSDAMVIGGQRIFEQFLPLTDTIALTVIHASPEGDTFFPELAGDEWKIIAREPHTSDERNKSDYTFLTYERVR